VRDSIEEFLQVEINAPAVAFGDVLLCLCHCLMSRSTGPEPVAVLGKRPVPSPLQNLHHRLLDESIQHRRDGDFIMHFLQ
jgi:site-specific DNA recombinase